jgi:CheY-like chemotaxis protein
MPEHLPGAESVTHAAVVLLVEDDESNREMYSVFLESAGYWVLEARNGVEGLINARTYQPSVVVTDVRMPGMDGWELARALRENDRTAQIAIIAVSGCAPDEAASQALTRRDVDVVLTKPCLPDELVRQIRHILARGRLARLHAGEQLAKANDMSERSRKPLKHSAHHRRRR